MPKIGLIDRELQLSLLTQMQAAYPGSLNPEDIAEGRTAAVSANLAYLGEHGLCSSGLSLGVDQRVSWGAATITHRGIDFLAADGGLSAILDLVTIKLHADTIRDLLAAKIEASPLPPDKKAGLRAALEKLPAVALQKGSERLMGLGIEHIGDIEGWLHGLSSLL